MQCTHSSNTSLVRSLCVASMFSYCEGRVKEKVKEMEGADTRLT